MAPVATLLPAARWGMVRYAAPVVTRERVRGFVSLCQPLAEGDLAEFDQLAASRTASLLAMELAKEDAVQAAEQRIQGDLVDELLHPFDAEGAGRRAAQAGLAARGTFAVYALALEGSPDGHAGVNLVTSASARGRRPRAAATALADGVGRHLRRAGRAALVRADGAELVVICQLTPAAGRRRDFRRATGPPAPGRSRTSRPPGTSCLRRPSGAWASPPSPPGPPAPTSPSPPSPTRRARRGRPCASGAGSTARGAW